MPAAEYATIPEVDEALWWTSKRDDRDAHWHRWVDHLLDQRNRISRGQASTTRQASRPPVSTRPYEDPHDEPARPRPRNTLGT